MFYNDRSLSGRRDRLSLSSIWSEGTKSFGSMYTTPVGRSGTKLGFNYSANSVHILDGDLGDLQVRGPASEITRPSGVNIVTSDVTKIYAEKIVGDAAVNIFDKFNMSANNIVNMYFKTSADAAVESNNLVNFVNSSVSVQGSEVYLDADRGSVSQGYHDGITNIGGGVQNLYNREYEAAKEAADEKFKGHEKNKTYETSENRQRSYNGNMIAGENIYINASDINVNGYIQSGYAKYELIIDADMQNTINADATKLAEAGRSGVVRRRISVTDNVVKDSNLNGKDIILNVKGSVIVLIIMSFRNLMSMR